MKNAFGFSLVELMTVMVIIGIVISISMPNFLKWRQDQQLNSAARNVQSIIQSIRLQALKENAGAEVEFDAVKNCCEARVLLRRSNGESVKRECYHLPAGIKIKRITFNKSLLRFNSRGLPAGGIGSVSLNNQCGTVRRIVVPITGNSRITS